MVNECLAVFSFRGVSTNRLCELFKIIEIWAETYNIMASANSHMIALDRKPQGDLCGGLYFTGSREYFREKTLRDNQVVDPISN